MPPNTLAAPLTLPCGAILTNRLCKAAMSEGGAGPDGRATLRLETPCRRWAVSGAGLLLSGNIQVDGRHLGSPLDVVVEDDLGMEALARRAAAGVVGGA